MGKKIIPTRKYAWLSSFKIKKDLISIDVPVRDIMSESAWLQFMSDWSGFY